MFPKTGETFLNGNKTHVDRPQPQIGRAAALSRRIKTVARGTGVSKRTAENWLVRS
jgi:hypothetical protein